MPSNNQSPDRHRATTCKRWPRPLRNQARRSTWNGVIDLSQIVFYPYFVIICFTLFHHLQGILKKIRSCKLFDKFQSYITVILKFFVAYFHTLTWHQNILSYIAILLSHIVILSSCHILCLSPHPALRQGKWQCCEWGRDHLGPCNIVLILLWFKCCHFKY